MSIPPTRFKRVYQSRVDYACALERAPKRPSPLLRGILALVVVLLLAGMAFTGIALQGGA